MRTSGGGQRQCDRNELTSWDLVGRTDCAVQQLEVTAVVINAACCSHATCSHCAPVAAAAR